MKILVGLSTRFAAVEVVAVTAGTALSSGIGAHGTVRCQIGGFSLSTFFALAHRVVPGGADWTLGGGRPSC